jgi:hypothetical protein
VSARRRSLMDVEWLRPPATKIEQALNITTGARIS